MVPSLAVLNSGRATLCGGKLTMSDISANSIVFADRPVRAAGHVLTADFIKQWDEGNDSFAKDPPNATISVLNSDGSAIEDAVVVLKNPKLDGDNLTFEVAVLEGSLSSADGPASLFIDWFAARGGFGRVGVVGGVGWHAPVWHGGWYASSGAAYGAGLATGALDRSGGGFGLPALLSASSLRLLPLSALLLRARQFFWARASGSGKLRAAFGAIRTFADPGRRAFRSPSIGYFSALELDGAGPPLPTLWEWWPWRTALSKKARISRVHSRVH